MFKNPFSFNGRIRRTEFGISYALSLFFIYGFAIAIEGFNLGGYQLIVLFAASYWFMFAQSAKRCHDLGNNGFYQFIPFYIFVLLFSEGHTRSNKYGADPKLSELQTNEVQLITPAKKLTLPKGKVRKPLVANC